jgi:hypothetical protein
MLRPASPDCLVFFDQIFVVADFYMAAGVLSQSTGYGTQGFASIITKFVGEVEVQDANVTRRQGTS